MLTVSERHHLIKLLEEKKFKFMNENTFLEVHCIDWIENLDDPNVTKLAKSLRVTRSAISKVTKHLVETGTIERYQKPENRKNLAQSLWADRGGIKTARFGELHLASID